MKKSLFSLRLVILAVLLSALFMNCTKEETPAPVKDFIRFKFNGVQYEYTVDVKAGFHTPENLYSLGISGYNKALSSSESFAILIYSNDKITAGKTFRDPKKAKSNTGKTFPQILLVYNNNTVSYGSAGLQSDENGVIVNANHYPSLKNIVLDAYVTITEITEKYVKGKFSGTVYNSKIPLRDATADSITDGEFVAEID